MEKQEQHPPDPKKSTGAGALAKQWHVFNRPNAAAAVTWLNSPPAQQAGEAAIGCGHNGTVDAYAFF